MARVTHIFGRRLKEAREKLAMTQREIGEAIGGISDETISRIERNEVAGILSKRLPKLAEVLGLTLEEFKLQFCLPQTNEPRTPQIALPASNISVLGEPKVLSDPTKLSGVAGLPGGLDLRRARPAKVLPEFQIGIAASRRVEKLADHPDGNRLVASGDRRAFTAPVDGDCQSPKWKHGEIVVFSFDAVEREGIISGRSYYLAFTDGSTTFKRVFKDDQDTEVFILRCWNRKKYPADQKVHREEIVRIARAISKQVVVDEEEE
jgi:transcriptional regulator with XRE-family HTH domain